MHLLWLGNYTSQSGYSQQARLFIPRLLEAGHSVTVMEIGGGISSPRIVNGVQVFSPHTDPFFTDIIQAHMERLKADAIISLFDVWGADASAYRDLKWFPMTPVDHVPAPPLVIENLRYARYPIAMTHFGEDMLRMADTNPLYLPLAYDGKVYRPQQADRKRFGLPDDHFVALFVGVNDSVPSRKGIPELLEAWAAFLEKYPKSTLYLHTSQAGGLNAGNAVGGVRIDLLLRTLGLENDDRVRIAPAYDYINGFTPSKMAALYAASDVLVLPSRGEGFGLPVVEAQACGCPVITTGFAAAQELCASGWLVNFEPEWTFQSAYQAHVLTHSIREMLEKAHAAKGDGKVRAEAADFAREYEIESVAHQHLPVVLEVIGEEVL